MIICGIKLTHDGSISLIDGQRLIFCYEMEKLNNYARYARFVLNMPDINEIFNRHGYTFDQVDKFVFDGWNPDDPQYLESGGDKIHVELAEYGCLIMKTEDVMQPKKFSMILENIKVDYSSYYHVAGHIAGAYCTSPMAKAGEDSYILIWDGGMFPQLFYYHCKTNRVENIGVLFSIIGNIYAIFPQHFGPFKLKAEAIRDDLSIAGKVMAYIAVGKYREEMIDIFKSLYEEHKDKGKDFAKVLAQEFIKKTSLLNYAAEDVLHTFHVFLEQLLVEKLAEMVSNDGGRSKNLCFAGGSALNIKWNSAIRGSGLFKNVWVPPFPNDSGSSIGAACCEMIYNTGLNYLEWNVFSGPPIMESAPGIGWTKKAVTISELAQLLFRENEPVVFLNGRAEWGPRALGSRSILAPATHASMKQVLNRIKSREDYRPVAPICLEEDAVQIFEPGTRDAYMLFDHHVKPEWKERIPAICHLDGTARLETVSEPDNPLMFQLLHEYKKVSGVPLLCNTSANFNGKGFFPDVLSAMQWNQVNYVWSGGYLYEKEEKIVFERINNYVEKTNVIVD